MTRAGGKAGSSAARGDAGGVTARRAALRETVLAVAERRVAAAGLPGLGIREVAAEAGCAVGMVYKLFSDHDALVLAVNARTLAQLGEAVVVAAASAGSRREAMLRMAEGYLDYAAEQTPRWDALFAHRMAAGAALPGWYVSLRDELFGRIADAVGGVSRGGVEARTLFSAVHGVVALGLGGKVADVPQAVLREELKWLVGVLADGMAGAGGQTS